MTNESPARSTTAVIEYLRSLQDSIATALERIDGGAKFRRDTWERFTDHADTGTNGHDADTLPNPPARFHG